MKKPKRMKRESSVESDNSFEDNSSDEELREAFRKGVLKPGLNVELKQPKTFANNIPKMKEKLDELIIELPWIERLDMTNAMAPLAPELAVLIERQEQKRENLFKGNRKIPYVKPENDPVLNDFKRETLFHRQAQTAATDGVLKLRELGISTKRPDDYFAEMAKTDEHMQKVRQHLTAKQEGQQKSEKIRQLREAKKMSKIIQRENEEKKRLEKTKMLTDLKSFRRGKLNNLDFLEDGARKPQGVRKGPNKKRALKDKKFGFGGKKKGSKRNTKESSMDVSDFKQRRNKSASFGGKGGGGAGGGKQRMGAGGSGKKPQQRMGKSRRVQKRK